MPLSGMAPLPGQVVGAEDRAVSADPLIPFARLDYAAEADAHRAAHVLLHRQLDRLLRADGAGHAVSGWPGQPRDGFEHRGRAARVYGVAPVEVPGKELGYVTV